MDVINGRPDHLGAPYLSVAAAFAPFGRHPHSGTAASVALRSGSGVVRQVGMNESPGRTISRAARNVPYAVGIFSMEVAVEEMGLYLGGLPAISIQVLSP